ncbi:hypothetical protein TNCV_2505411 [Trichonephila clavipes]|uniref:Uncharacterized protein n=1 Tax=Trichonephila clavipes TaxID=2585209 RepID=A0A8X6WFS6_TRICX|nr:hypothetical protein TNCV_2505411 [Trichonephila clavipes]
MQTYKLDPCWYFTIPALSWDAMLLHTEVAIELFTDYDMPHFIEKGGAVELLSPTAISKTKTIAGEKQLNLTVGRKKKFNSAQPAPLAPRRTTTIVGENNSTQQEETTQLGTACSACLLVEELAFITYSRFK